jgi:hypothetical protein
VWIIEATYACSCYSEHQLFSLLSAHLALELCRKEVAIIQHILEGQKEQFVLILFDRVPQILWQERNAYRIKDRTFLCV